MFISHDLLNKCKIHKSKGKDTKLVNRLCTIISAIFCCSHRTTLVKCRRGHSKNVNTVGHLRGCLPQLQITWHVTVLMEVTSGKRKLTIDDVRRERGTVDGARALSTRLERMGSSTKWRDLIDKGSHSNWREKKIYGYRCR